MKVLIISDAQSVHTQRWVSSLSGKGVDVVLYSIKPYLDDFYSSKGIKCYFFDLFSYKRDGSGLFGAFKKHFQAVIDTLNLIIEVLGAKEAIFGIKMFVSCALTVLFMIFYQVPVTWKVLWVIPLWLLLFMITFACTTIITHFGVFVEDLMNVLTVALQLGFYISGIFYSIETRIVPKNELIGNLLIHCNPIALIMTDMRNVLLYNKEPHYISLLIWAVVSIIVAAIGVRTIYKHENTYVKII